MHVFSVHTVHSPADLSDICATGRVVHSCDRALFGCGCLADSADTIAERPKHDAVVFVCECVCVYVYVCENEQSEHRPSTTANAGERLRAIGAGRLPFSCASRRCVMCGSRTQRKIERECVESDGDAVARKLTSTARFVILQHTARRFSAPHGSRNVRVDHVPTRRLCSSNSACESPPLSCPSIHPRPRNCNQFADRARHTLDRHAAIRDPCADK